MEKLKVPFWFGIVEKRDDYLQIGRCKVRIFGYHTADRASLPTDELPWAYPVEPLQGTFFSTAREGDTVFGIFLDAEEAQSPLILGKVPTAEQNEVKHPAGDGYRDARSEEELKYYPRQLVQAYDYNLNGRGVTTREFDKALRYPPYTQATSIPFRARMDPKRIPEQIHPETKKQQASITRFITAKGETWFELPSQYATIYPFNKVFQTESLHLLEFDDTPSAERIQLMHRLGSGLEFAPDGSVVEKIVKDGYTVVLGNKKVGIIGDCDITVNGNATLHIKGDLTQHIGGNYHLSVDGNMSQKVSGDVLTNTLGNSKHKVSGDIVSVAQGTHHLHGSKIHLNSKSGNDVDDITDFDLPNILADSLSFENQQKLIEITGSTLAPTDDKDESLQADLNGETVSDAKEPKPIDCPFLSDENKQFTNGDSRYRMQLSKYYQLADLSIRAIYPHHLQDQCGLVQDEIICNLAYLSQNVLDALISKYPGAQINSAFRKQQNNRSQHETGEAVDLQWSAIKVGSLSKYLEIATWIKENLPFDQLIMEHGNTIWLHISLKKNGVNRKQILTMKDGLFKAGLSLEGRS